jgi:hypothetical protein
MKKCTTCGIEKPLTMYFTNRNSIDGHQNICKSCKRIKVKKTKKKKKLTVAERKIRNQEMRVYSKKYYAKLKAEGKALPWQKQSLKNKEQTKIRKELRKLEKLKHYEENKEQIDAEKKQRIKAYQQSPEAKAAKRAYAQSPERKKRATEAQWKRKGVIFTIEERDRMLELQQGLCAICGELPKEGKNLDLDHCHTTGKVRGFLCNNCNIALGLVSDDIKILRNLYTYLTNAGGAI